MRKPIFFLCVIIIALFGCKKKQLQVAYYPVPDALKKACLFQKGSYWVYRNDSTSITDCTYVKVNAIAGSISFPPNNLTDFIKTPLESGIFNQFYISGKIPYDDQTEYPFLADMHGIGLCCPGKPAFILFGDTLTNHQGFESCNCGSDKNPDCDCNSFFQLGQYSIFNINDLTFNRVGITRTQYRHPFSYPPGDTDTIDFFFSPANGLVKMVFRIDTSHTIVGTQKRTTIS